VKVLDADLTGEWPTIAEGITWAADHGADVVNLSVGSPGAIDSVGAAVAYALAKGVIVVAAAGNAGTGQTFYPAAYPGVVSVAGVDATTARYPWSDFGSWVSVAAPGCVGDFCGTSTAAPFVAGIAGLARSLDPHLLPSTFSTALAASTTPLSDPTTAAAGLPDAGRLLAALAASTTPTPDPTTAAAALPDARRLLAAHRVRSSGYRLPAPLRDSRRPAPALR
jgi:subtilisin family serine protease